MRRKERTGIRAMKNKTPGGSIIRNTVYAHLAAFILSSLSATIGSLVDGVIIGQYLGVDSMAAFGIIAPLLTAFSRTGTLVSAGARNRFSRFVGEGKLAEAQGVFSLSVVLAVGSAAVSYEPERGGNGGERHPARLYKG